MISVYSTDKNKDIITLDEFESHHCTNVMRLKINDPVNVFDGKGNLYKAVITEINKRCVTLKVVEHCHYKNKSDKVHIAIAPTKSQDRLEWFVEKSVELGVSKISFVMTARTERKKINMNRCTKIIIAAMKQSGRLYIPEIQGLCNFNTFIENSNEEARYICTLDNNKLNKNIYDRIESSKNQCFIIGPEGDFTSDEISLANKNGYESISLGDNVLRTETAGIFVAAACKIINKNG